MDVSPCLGRAAVLANSCCVRRKAKRLVGMQLADGEHVLAIEQYFVVGADTESISREGWTAEEVEVYSLKRWSLHKIRGGSEGGRRRFISKSRLSVRRRP